MLDLVGDRLPNAPHEGVQHAGCVLALAGCGGGGTFPALAPPVASKPDDNGIVTLSTLTPEDAGLERASPMSLNNTLNDTLIGGDARTNAANRSSSAGPAG